MKKKKTVFIAEDDLLSAEYLKAFLEKENYSVLDITDTGEESVKKCKLHKPDIILMDIMLKGQMSGSEAAVEIKQFCPECKIIFLTAYADREMIDYAVEAKAYAYLMKPYREKEILATIKVALISDPSSSEKDLGNDMIVLKNNFTFDSKHRLLYKNGQETPLTSKKLKLIELLAKNRDHTVSNEQICMYVWGEMKSNSTLRSLIHRFRAAVDDDIISNMNGVGYSISTK